jgi:transposase
MLLYQQTIPLVPEETARIACAVLPKGNTWTRMRDELETFFQDEDFLNLFSSEEGQSAVSTWRLALVMVMQYAEGLTDRQAADAVRMRIDWKYALSLEITDQGFDASVLSEFRDCLLTHRAERRLFDALISRFQVREWVKGPEKDKTSSSYVLTSVRAVNRLECVKETMCHALNVLAEVAPDWLMKQVQPEWSRYKQSHFRDLRLPKSERARIELAEQIGEDGRDLLEKVYHSTACRWLREVPAIEAMRVIWMQQYYASEQGTPWRKDQDLPLPAQLIRSPYDGEARYCKMRQAG